ncbi:pirin family protein [Kordiimonas gwangyangensis]|uniref:pirin family protein n=1 Tax=Kordiimonas gwangyangensis TaxID=288022 RepID=UPI000374EB21|nr:pirin family protein [Kordiimonas gwangyangensis]
MSRIADDRDPECSPQGCPEPVDVVIIPRTGDIGGFMVERALPSRQKRMIGPFVFWDQMGPGEFLTGQGIDVRPHPHIGLSTVTYLFDGTLDHRDSLGTHMTILPGELNLMTAGSGIVHSERTGPTDRAKPSRLYGIQSWLAQPKTLEGSAPAFKHYGSSDLPTMNAEGIEAKVILGEAFGLKSPVETDWETLYADITLAPGAVLPLPRETEERAVYIVRGKAEIAGTIYPSGQMISLRPGADVSVKALGDVHLMLLGGAAMDGPRYIWWNFVGSSMDRIRDAAERWQAQSFAKVPGDEEEFIPLPDIKTLDRVKA